MKKYLFFAIATIVAFSSCGSDDANIESVVDDNDKQQNVNITAFNATITSDASTRTIYNVTSKMPEWIANTDKINVGGAEYTAQASGTTSTFTGNNATKGTDGKYHAYYPANLVSGSVTSLPASYTYDGNFNMPMYAESTTNELAFKNICAVLAVKVTSDDIASLKSIKVSSDKALNGEFSISDNKAVLTNPSDITKTVELVCTTPLTLDATGTTFYIPIPAQDYAFLNIYLSADGSTYKEAMATKKVAGIGTLARNKIFNINYEKNAVQLWSDGPYIATVNIGVNSTNSVGGFYAWGGSQDKVDDHQTGNEDLTSEHDTATKLWGSNWRLPSSTELSYLISNCDVAWYDNWNTTGQKGREFTGKGDYAVNSVFLVAGGYYMNGSMVLSESGNYMSSNHSSTNMMYYLGFSSTELGVYTGTRSAGFSVRAVLR